MNPRNRFFILLGIIFVIALGYYFFSTPSNKDLVLIGTVDSNQVIVSPQTQGRLQKLLVDEGTPVKAGQLIAVIDPAELQAEAAAASANISSLRSKVSGMRYTEQSTQGSTSSDVANAQAKLRSMTSQLAQAQAALERTQSDSRRMIELAKQGVASDQERVQAETNLTASKANVQSLKDQVTAAEADLNAAVARTHQANAAQSTVALDAGRFEECRGAEAASRSAAWLHQYLRPRDWNGFGACGERRRSAECRAADRDHRGSRRHLGARRDSGDGSRPHRLRRYVASALAGGHGNERQSIF